MPAVSYLAVSVTLLALNAQAAPADWKSYLCRYTTKSILTSSRSEHTQLVRVNEKDGRVLFDDRDADSVKIDDNTIHFETRYGEWTINKGGGALVMRRSTVRDKEIGEGTCKVVGDSRATF